MSVNPTGHLYAGFLIMDVRGSRPEEFTNLAVPQAWLSSPDRQYGEEPTREVRIFKPGE